MKIPMLKSNVKHSSRSSAPESVSDRPSNPGGVPSGTDEIAKLRDILLGQEMRDHREQLRLFTDRVTQELTQIRRDVQENMAKMEPSRKRDLEEVSSRLDAEGKHREDASKELEMKLHEFASTVEQKLHAIRDSASQGHSELRNQLLAQGNLMMDALQQRHEEATGVASRGMDELKAQKVDRETLSKLLIDLGTKLDGSSSS